MKNINNKQFIKVALKAWLKKILPARYIQLLKIIKKRFLITIKGDINYYYNNDFATHPLHNKRWAGSFCDIVLRTFNPKSVIDFGCGTADVLCPFEKKQINILGIDGSVANRNHCHINKDNFFLFDIRKPYKSKEKYDLCFCLEVAEHIEEKYSDTLINNLIQSSSNIVFTAAPPGQEGLCHINLKPYDWWIQKFEGVNFKFQKLVTEHLKQEMTKIPNIPQYYINNLLVFKFTVDC